MNTLEMWFLDVGHGDCSYILLPNGARMMIDCGGDNHWPSKLLKYSGITASGNSVNIPNVSRKYGLDNLVISHPHGDHFSDIIAIHDDIRFYSLTGHYGDFIDKITINEMDFRKRNNETVLKFVNIVKKYSGEYKVENDRIKSAEPVCIVKQKRFIQYEDGIDLNELSYLVSLEIGGVKVLFTGDLTAKAVDKILLTDKADDFINFVKGTTILKVPHHGRENGCSQQLFDAIGKMPLLCIVSDEVLNEKNEGTSNTKWYTERTSNQSVKINGTIDNRRKVLTTRQDKDIYIEISENGNIAVQTNYFQNIRQEILNNF